MKKYEFTGKTIKHDGKTLQQIRALRDFDNASKGDIGGWIESEKNLSHEGGSWVEKDAIISRDAIVRGDAYVKSHAIITGKAIVENDSRVGEYARIDGSTHIEYGSIGEHAHITGEAHIACGQDGPPVYPYSAIDFDVAYGNDYFLIAVSYDWHGLHIAVSQSGQVAFQEWDGETPRVWSGTVSDFAKKVSAEYSEYEEMKQAVKMIQSLN